MNHPRIVNDVVHFPRRPAALGSLIHVGPRGISLQLKSSYLRHSAGKVSCSETGTCARCSSARSVQSKSSVVLSGGERLSCALFTAARLRGLEKSADKFCRTSVKIQNLSKINEPSRTELSDPSLASTAIGSAFAILRSWPSQKRQKPTLRMRPDTTRAHADAGLQMTQSRQPKHSEPCSQRS